jgi:hypothetical protein
VLLLGKIYSFSNLKKEKADILAYLRNTYKKDKKYSKNKKINL